MIDLNALLDASLCLRMPYWHTILPVATVKPRHALIGEARHQLEQSPIRLAGMPFDYNDFVIPKTFRWAVHLTHPQWSWQVTVDALFGSHEQPMLLILSSEAREVSRRDELMVVGVSQVLGLQTRSLAGAYLWHVGSSFWQTVSPCAAATEHYHQLDEHLRDHIQCLPSLPKHRPIDAQRAVCQNCQFDNFCNDQRTPCSDDSLLNVLFPSAKHKGERLTSVRFVGEEI